jgi:hypothetical protein
MKSILKIILILILLSSCNLKKEDTYYSKYERVMGENSWGYVDINGKTVIPLGKYSFLNPIDEKGMILAKLGNKYGYIDIHEKCIVPFIYDDVSSFTNDLAAVMQNYKYGYINRSGELVIPIEYENESSLKKSGLILVKKENKYGFIDKKGKVIIPIIYENAIDSDLETMVGLKAKKKWAFFNKEGSPLTPFIYDDIKSTCTIIKNIYTSSFLEHQIILVKKDHKIGGINSKFEEVIPFGIFDSISHFNSKKIAIASKGKQFGLIDNRGALKIDFNYDEIIHPEINSSSSEVFAARKNKLWELISSRGKIIMRDLISLNWNYSNGKSVFTVMNKNHNWGVIDDNGILLIPLIYQDLENFDGKIFTIAKKNNYYGIIDNKNKTIYPFDNQEIIYVDESKTFIVKKNNKFGLIDTNGKVCLDIIYDNLFPSFLDKNTKFIANKNGKCGIIDKKGTVSIPFNYESISNWVEYGPDAHIVKQNHKIGLLSYSGAPIIPCKYDTLEYISDAAIIISINNKYGIIDIHNKIKVPLEYDYLMIEPNYYINQLKDHLFYTQKANHYSVIDVNDKDISSDLTEQEIKKKIELYKSL